MRYKELLLILITVVCVTLVSYTLLLTDTKSTQSALKKNRLLVIMPAYKRPVYLSGQILRMMNQTYDNFHVSVSAKGIPTELLEKTVLTEWEPFMKAGRLTVFMHDNKDQFSNFIDPFRELDLSQYDYICKIDDDDWYAPSYLENINEYLNKADHISISYTYNFYNFLYNRQKNPPIPTRYIKNYMPLTGNNMCFSTDLAKLMMQIEQDPHTIPELTEHYEDLRRRNEDNFIMRLPDYVPGVMQNRSDAPFLLIYNRAYRR